MRNVFRKIDGASHVKKKVREVEIDMAEICQSLEIEPSGVAGDNKKIAEQFTNEHWDERLKQSTDPNSPFFENLRRLRFPILYTRNGRKARKILVTSTVPNEGKGFVCANLGVAIAQDMEHSALMVDCDLRKPSLAQLFGLAHETGLVDYLQHNVNPSVLIRKTGQSKLSLMPSGKSPRHPAELLTSQRMISLIDELEGRYDDRIILFDSPPHIVASETLALAEHLDAVILVVRHGVSRKEQVKKVVDAIGADKILGIVFNACPVNKIESFFYRKFGYGYNGYFT